MTHPVYDGDEDLKSAFYAEALAHGKLDGELRRFAEVAGAHERAHAARIRRALGRHARPAPSFRFGKATRERASFIATAPSSVGTRRIERPVGPVNPHQVTMVLPAATTA